MEPKTSNSIIFLKNLKLIHFKPRYGSISITLNKPIVLDVVLVCSTSSYNSR